MVHKYLKYYSEWNASGRCSNLSWNLNTLFKEDVVWKKKNVVWVPWIQSSHGILTLRTTLESSPPCSAVPRDQLTPSVVFSVFHSFPRSEMANFAKEYLLTLLMNLHLVISKDHLQESPCIFRHHFIYFLLMTSFFIIVLLSLFHRLLFVFTNSFIQSVNVY